MSEAHFPDRVDCRTEARNRRRGVEGRALTQNATQEAHRETWLWFAQRASAAVLALCVIAHLITIIYATRGGLSGAEILARTRGNSAWLSFYVLFVLAVAVHVPIGLRAIAAEWLGWNGSTCDWALAAFGVALLVMGCGAAWAVFL